MSAALILGDEPRIVVSIARSLARHGVAVDAAALSPQAPIRASRAIRRFVRLPDHQADPGFFLAWFLKHLDAHPYDRLIPASDTALSLVGRYWPALSHVAAIGCPPPQIVRRVLDKTETLRIAQDLGVPIPTTYADPTARLEDGSLRYPLIAKPRGKAADAGVPFKVHRFNSATELRDSVAARPAILGACIFQEYCEGIGVGIETLMHRGEPIALFQHRRIKELPSTGGVSVIAESQAVDPVLADHAVRLLRALAWDGVAMVEFRVEPGSGRAVLMEVNGRYWGSLALSIRAGMDFPWFEWQLAHGVRPRVPDRYRIGLRARWTPGAIERWHGEVRRGGAGRGTFGREVLTLLADCAPGTADMLWSWRDPRPALHEAGRALAKVLWHEAKQHLTRLLPAAVVAIRAKSRLLGSRARRVFLKRAILRELRLINDRVPGRLTVSRFVLFVCHGNIIRSPMAAALLKEALRVRGQRTGVESAGLHADPLKPADPRAIVAAEAFGVSLRDHRAIPLTPDLVRRADAIFVMDAFNEAELLGRFPYARGKVYFLRACGRPSQGVVEIDDPYRGDLADVTRCYRILHECVEELAARLVPSAARSGMAPALYAERHPASSR